MDKAFYWCVVLGLGTSLSSSTGCNNDGSATDCAHGACENHDACEGGWICSDGCCSQVCNADADCDFPCTAEDRSGETCDAGLCMPGCRDDAPEIMSIDGNGPENQDSNPATSTHHLVNGLVVEGNHLDGARVSITGPGLSETVLAVAEGRTSTHLEACLPRTLGPGAYTLSLVNQQGEACGDFQLVPGPRGDEGPAGTYVAGAGIVIDNGVVSADIDCPIGYAHDTSRTDIVLCTRGADEMVKVGDFWVDRYEAHIVNADAYNDGACNGTAGDPTAYGESGDDYPDTFPNNGNVANPADKLYACSVPGVAPSRYVTWFQAQQACTASGKHLITNVEWQAAAAGAFDPGSFDGSANPGCNTSSSAGGPRLTASAGSTPGAAGSCISIHGAEDMVGNLWEWTAAWFVAGQHYNGEPAEWKDGTLTTSQWPDASYGADLSRNVAGRSVNGAEYVTGLPAAAFRGGCWMDGSYAGVFAVAMTRGPSSSAPHLGARCARRR